MNKPYIKQQISLSKSNKPIVKESVVCLNSNYLYWKGQKERMKKIDPYSKIKLKGNQKIGMIMFSVVYGEKSVIYAVKEL